jgi:hypothetical protein
MAIWPISTAILSACVAYLSLQSMPYLADMYFVLLASRHMATGEVILRSIYKAAHWSPNHIGNPNVDDIFQT